jgi:manganese transport protein
MEGYLRLRINPVLRRLLTRVVAITPAIIVIVINGEKNIDSLLILSQVILSLQLGFAIIPLIHFVSDKKTMGQFVINNLTKILAWLITVVLVYLNMRMVTEQAVGYFESGGTWYWKAIIILSGLIFAGLLVMTIFFPLLKRFRKESSSEMHQAKEGLELTEAPAFNRIAIALDFSENDSKLLAFAIGQSNPSSKFILIHVVESVPAKFYEQ